MIQYSRRATSLLLVFITWVLCPAYSSGQDIHVFADGETAIFSELALNTNTAAVWSTDRSSIPGYLSAIADAAYSGAVDGTSFLVDGYVKYYRGTAASVSSFVFPVGQANDYRPVTIAGTIPNNTIFAAAWFAGDPAVTTDPTDGAYHDRNSKGIGVASVLAQGFWDWQNLAGNASGMTITVSIPDVSAYALAASLVLVGWDGSKWINLSGAAGAGPYSNNWANGNMEGSLLSGTWQTDITALAIGSLSFLLPLKLEHFTAKTNDCTANLTWKTAQEENTSHFTVESTIDGINWRQLAKITSQGNGAGKEYRYSVPQNKRVVLYRLLMADRTGQATYSPVVALTSYCAMNKYLKVFPNPSSAGSGTLNILLLTSYRGEASLLLHNTAGQVLLNRRILLAEGSNTLSLETDVLVPGTYLLSIVDEKGRTLYQPKQIIKK